MIELFKCLSNNNRIIIEVLKFIIIRKNKLKKTFRKAAFTEVGTTVIGTLLLQEIRKVGSRKRSPTVWLNEDYGGIYLTIRL